MNHIWPPRDPAADEPGPELWLARPGAPPVRFGFRDTLREDAGKTLRWLSDQGWRGQGAPPPLPDDVRCEAARRYIEAYEQISGSDFAPDVEDPVSGLECGEGEKDRGELKPVTDIDRRPWGGVAERLPPPRGCRWRARDDTVGVVEDPKLVLGVLQ